MRPEWAGKRVLVIGDVMLDVHQHGAAEGRQVPECPGAPVLRVEREERQPGGAGRVAAAVAGYGGRASLLSVTGADQAGLDLWRLLHNLGVDALLSCDESRPTTVKRRVFAGPRLVCRIDEESHAPIAAGHESLLLRWLADLLPTADVVILSDYSKGVCTPTLCRAVIARARQAGLPVVVDPKGQDWSKYAGCTLIKPNLSEMRRGYPSDDFPAVLTTLGADGMSLAVRGQPHLHIPARPCADFPTLGAGDRVAAALALGLASGASLEQAARAAAEVCHRASFAPDA